MRKLLVFGLFSLLVISVPVSALAQQPGEMAVSKSNPSPGEMLTVSGNCGKTSSDQTVNFALDGKKLNETANSDNQGQFTGRVTIPPDQPEGPAMLTAECTGNGKKLSKELHIQRR